MCSWKLVHRVHRPSVQCSRRRQAAAIDVSPPGVSSDDATLPEEVRRQSGDSPEPPRKKAKQTLASGNERPADLMTCTSLKLEQLPCEACQGGRITTLIHKPTLVLKVKDAFGVRIHASVDERGWHCLEVAPSGTKPRIIQTSVNGKYVELVQQVKDSLRVYVNPRYSELDEWELPAGSGSRMKVGSPKERNLHSNIYM